MASIRLFLQCDEKVRVLDTTITPDADGQFRSEWISIPQPSEENYIRKIEIVDSARTLRVVIDRDEISSFLEHRLFKHTLHEYTSSEFSFDEPRAVLSFRLGFWPGMSLLRVCGKLRIKM